MVHIQSGKFVQTYSSLSSSFEAVDDCGRVLARAFVRDNRPFEKLDYISICGAHLTLRRDLTDEIKNIGRPRDERLHECMFIQNDFGQIVGRIARKSMTVPRRHQCYEVIYQGMVYIVYSVGLGKAGIKYPVYCACHGEERQVALVEKPAVVVDMKDIFDYYAADGTALDPLFLFILYTDFLNFGNYGVAKVLSSKRVSCVWTFNSYEKSKYDASFKWM